MRRLLLAALLAILPALAHAQAEVGKTAPLFSVADINGNMQELENYRGKIVVLEWHNPGCPFVVKHYGSDNMQKLQAYARDKGVVWLTINSSAEGKQGHLLPVDAKAYLSQMQAEPLAYILDATGKLGQMYGAQTTPHMFVIDKLGKIAYAGAIDSVKSTNVEDIPSATNYVKNAIDALVAGQPVNPNISEPYGCGVKY